MKSGSTRAMGQNRKYRALKLLLPLLAFALLLGFGPQAGVSYAEPSGDTGTPTSSAPATDPSDNPALPESAGAPASPPEENTTPADPKPQPGPAKEPGAPASDPAGTFDLTKFLTDDAKLFYGGTEITKDKEGKYTVHPDTRYQLQLGFKEDPDGDGDEGQIPLDKELTYGIPEGLKAFDAKKPKNFTITLDEGQVDGNQYWVEDNKIHVRLKRDNALGACRDAYFFVTLDVQFAKNAKKINLADDIDMNVLISNDPDLSITKSARHDFAAGKVFYTLTVTSIDTNENVVVSDQIQGKDTVLHLDQDRKAFKIKSTNKKAPKPGVPQFGKNGFTLTIPKMTHGEQVTIEYSASVDYSKVDTVQAGTKEQTTNKANAVSDQIPVPKETTNDLDQKLKIGSMVKNAGTAKEKEGEPGVYTQPWTLKVNEYRKLNVKGYTIKDSIHEYKDFMKYTGEGLTLKVNKGEKDADGKPVIEEKTIPWAQVGVNDFKTDTAWKYELPDNASYEISYETTVNVNANILPKAVSNQASSTNPHSSETPEIVKVPTNSLKPAHLFSLEKKALEVTKDQVKWQISVNVVPQGYKSLKLTDTLPTATSNGKTYRDTLKLDNLAEDIQVDGLIKDEESYKFEQDPNNPGSFSITFFKVEDGETKPGLKPYKDKDGKPADRKVTVTFTTNNNSEWMDAYEKGDSSLYRHINKVKAKANGEELATSAEATPTLENINKTFGGITYKEKGGVDYPVFNYRLRLEGLDKCNEGSPNKNDRLCTADNLKIVDEFNAQTLQLVTKPKPSIEGTDELEATQNGGKIDFSIKRSYLPKDREGNYLSVYYLYYSLIPSNREALYEINKNPKELTVKNKAKWGPVETKDVDATYVYGPLTKEVTEKPTKDNQYEATFKVTINPGGLDIANGAPTANFKDEMTNLRLQPETLEMTPKDFNYHPVYKDGVLTMEVPNKQKVVVTYKAKVIGKDLVNYGNEVAVGKEKSKVAGSVAVRMDMGAGGGGSNPGITIHKHDSRDLTTGLEGAEFELYRVTDGNPEPIIGKLSEDQTEPAPLRFTTDEDGNVTIKGHSDLLGWGLVTSNEKKQYVYQLREVKSPKGYKLLEKPLTFTIWKNPADETQQYNGAYIYVANEPEPGTKIPGKPGDVHKKLGKTGAQVSVALGAMLACLAGGYLILRRREQR